MESVIPFDLVVILVSAALLGLIADRLRQPTLVAYLVAGILVGPGILSIADPTDLVDLMAELGLAFLLFLIGLKLDFSEIEHIYKPVVKISVVQMALTALISFLTALILGFNPFIAGVLGLAFMYSSTAVVIKLLKDSGGISKQYGKINTGILLVQDITVVILMVLITSADTDIVSSLVSASLFLLLAAGVTYFASKNLLPRILQEASKDSVTLFITGLAWLFIFVIAAESFGLSIEIGAFIAGLGLGQVSYSTELVEKMTPVTDFFIAMFFVNFGLSLSLGEFLTYWKEALLLAPVLMVTKFVVIRKLVDWQGFGLETSFKSGLTMTQTSEFSLIFIAAAASVGLISGSEVGMVSLVAILTMSLSSYLILFHNQIFERLYPGKSVLKSEDGPENHAVIAGYIQGLESIIERLGEKYGRVVVVDNDPDVVKNLSEARFGDFHHRALREDLGLDKADFVMINFEDESLVKEILDEIGDDTILLAESEEEIEGAETYTSEVLLGEGLRKYIRRSDL